MNTDVVLPASLDALDGPVEGVVSLPNHLNWSGVPVYDLTSPRRVESLYTTVIREALNMEDLEYLNKKILFKVWANLNLPTRVRRVWESTFSELGS